MIFNKFYGKNAGFLTQAIRTSNLKLQEDEKLFI